MAVETFTVNGKKGITLHGIKTLPKKSPKAVIQIFHGMGEHKNRYIPFMEFMATAGYACYAHDHPNHGESIREEGAQGIWLKQDRWDDVLDSAYLVTRHILKEQPGSKLIIMGHSMGSIIARGFISKNPLLPHAAIIMGTLPPYTSGKAFVPIMLANIIKLFSPAKKRSQFLATVLNKPLIAPFEEPRTPFEWLTHDTNIIDQYVEDPLCGYAYTAQFYTEFLKAIVQVNKSDFILRTKDIPILFISGKADPVGENGEGVNEIYQTYNGHGYTALTLKLFDEMYHEVLNETNHQIVFDYLKDWCDSLLE